MTIVMTVRQIPLCNYDYTESDPFNTVVMSLMFNSDNYSFILEVVK